MTKTELLQELWEDAGGRILTGTGRNSKATCPFHEDRNPSASVNLDEGLWQCFSCARAGDVYTLIQEQLGGDFEQAARIVEARTGEAAVSSAPLKRKSKPYKPSWL